MYPRSVTLCAVVTAYSQVGCFYPLQGYRSKQKEPSGKRKIVFNPKHGIQDEQIDVPCGQCIGCKLERSKNWAIRCVHEASMHADNAFITLTYRPEDLPENGNLVKRDFQDFMKALRHHFNRDIPEYLDNEKTVKNPAFRKIRYYMCGEYGSQYDDQGNQITKTYIINGKEKQIPIVGRPHFHACLFGVDFPDKEHWQTRLGIPLYRSATLEKLWTKGYSSIGEVNFQSAAYVARYVAKKMNGDYAETPSQEDGLTHYQVITEDGEIFNRQEEYTNMSRRPGIGKDWFEHYTTDVFEHDSVIINGKEVKPPRYYDNLYEQIDEVGYENVKEKRRIAALNSAKDNNLDRLRAKETVKLAQVKMLKRELN